MSTVIVAGKGINRASSTNHDRAEIIPNQPYFWGCVSIHCKYFRNDNNNFSSCVFYRMFQSEMQVSKSLHCHQIFDRNAERRNRGLYGNVK